MKLKPKKDDNSKITFTIKKEQKNKYNESYEATLDNIHALTVFAVKSFGRMGYMIKKLEEILEEIKKANKGQK